MEDFYNESEEIVEVAEPLDSESEENVDVAEPQGVNDVDGLEDDLEDDVLEDEDDEEENGKTDADSAFASLRRELQETQTHNKALEEALGYFFEGDDKDIQAQAYAEGKTIEEVKAQREELAKQTLLEEENEQLKDYLLNLEVEKAISDSVRDIGKIDPNIKSVEDLETLGDEFLDFIENGLSPVHAYFASKSMREATGYKAPENIGKINESATNKDFFSKEEVEQMSQEEVKKNYELIRKSMVKW